MHLWFPREKKGPKIKNQHRLLISSRIFFKMVHLAVIQLEERIYSKLKEHKMLRDN